MLLSDQMITCVGFVSVTCQRWDYNSLPAALLSGDVEGPIIGTNTNLLPPQTFLETTGTSLLYTMHDRVSSMIPYVVWKCVPTEACKTLR